jgi:hypothetical protein
VHWFVLLLVWWVLIALIGWLAPQSYQNLLNSLVADAWVFYFCLWIRALDPESQSPFWCDVYVVVELACAATTIQQSPSARHMWITGILGLASSVLGIATIYLIRSDLKKHYNEREPIGLQLNPWMTFFFSFLYFQSQLYGIAQFKKRQAEGMIDYPGHTLQP